ncbi:MAG: HEPN domain-containing protein [Candidatus Nanoarchaeia archaeon]|nr:HEPN domain-containing protein [Candidatus Nanoarchaeia archaeon]MDD5239068.1 HEPN domain-containing protein [Candidatus Nanoarchaeia archaeon]
MDINEAKDEGLISDLPKEENVTDIVEKEIKSAEYDLSEAKEGFSKGKTKWPVVQAYYVIFHAARALMYKFKLKEIKHEGIVVFLEERVKVGKLRNEFVTIFKSLKSTREDSNYDSDFSEERARKSIESAEEFLKEMKAQLSEKKAGKTGKQFVFLLL